ncbi:hypothetical protein [Anaerococcus hydrogenalis]|jgi:hypothetical protein|uniref:hypothetical protein n=1 Tax=Anaerococcus hydrogenalis TaxID=33029 RepID=UPI0029010562|nr:hypothetical protein [Anaerococcus hydrogenalis]MDU1316662.1 hypothetical protein [Anaerococcus hydrogenalis]
MSKFVCDEKKYLVSRTNEEGREELAQIDEYSGNIYWINTLDRVYRFENIEDAKSFKLSQESLAKSLKKEWKFEILEEHTIVNEGE